MSEQTKQTTAKVVAPCDHRPLQECLLKNNNDRSKCMKEWNDFQQACQRKKKENCEACQKD
ncbi:hypothetical protein BCR42DRAFT_409575 [Absidia repens]|uniref:Cysteine alpha-hairpin motif superfamily n=1 Tax=Absidia repens TaxID=90262 RepID=A0A1X2IMS6_9FUNG|nr:hypothetical protein BCR42DRAFT_409575 [Absidia repens]